LQAALKGRLGFSPGQSPQLVPEADPLLKPPKFMTIQDGLSLGYFTSFRKGVFLFFGEGPGGPIAFTIQGHRAGSLTEAVQGGGT